MSENKEQNAAAVAEEVVIDIVNEVAEATNEANTTEEVIENLADKVEEKVEEVISETTELLEEKVEEVKDEVLETLKEKVKAMGVKKSTLALIIKFTMEAVEKTPKKGAGQKDYALRLIRALVVDLATGEDKDFLLTAIDSGAVGDTIDLIVQATQGELDVNNVVEVATKSCLPCCLSLLAKRTNKK